MVHIAVLLKPYLDLILSGKKTVECRLTRQARDPYERIEPGERIYFKLSAGPYAATALAEHVMFEDKLTPKRITELRRDYNHQICGDSTFWNYKRHSNYCTLIWLKDVQATDAGPAIRPLQGVAWLTLEEDPAWRRTEQNRTTNLFPSTSFMVEVTDGNLRNNSLYLTNVIDRFPRWAMGGKNKKSAARPLTLLLHQGPTVQSDIVASRNMLRTRAWRKWFADHGVKKGDRVVFTPVNETTYSVGLSRSTPARTRT